MRWGNQDGLVAVMLLFYADLIKKMSYILGDGFVKDGYVCVLQTLLMI